MRSSIPGVGPLNCNIALVGEAGGIEEEKQGKPFVGSSGSLLNDLLASCGIIRSRCYVTNVIKEHPYKNNIKLFIDLSKKYPVVTEEYKRYERELKEELSKCSANVIVAVGAVALWALCREKKITKRRGSILRSTLLPGRKVIPIIHPAAALRQYINTRYINLDLIRVAEESRFPDIKDLDPCYYHIITKFDIAIRELNSIIDRVKQGKILRLSFDIECDRTTHELTAFGSCYKYKNKEHAISIGLYNNKENSLSTIEETNLILLLEKVLKLDVEYVLQNGMFDATFMFRKYGCEISPWLDTMVGMGIAHPDYPKGLDFITSVFTKMPYFKDEGKEVSIRSIVEGHNEDDLKITLNDEPLLGSLDRWERFLLYNAKDCRATLVSIDPILEDIEALGNLDIFNQYSRIYKPLIYMSERGVKLNVEELNKIKSEAILDVENLKREFEKIAPGVSPTSNQQLQNYFYITLGYKPYLNRKTHKPTVDAEAMIRLTRKGAPGAKEISKIRKLDKLISTYYNINAPGGRLRGSYNPIGTKQGRLSSSATIFGEGTNLQNQPKAMKKLMVADEGMMLFDCDLSQAENRIVAYVGSDKRFIEAFEDGVDVHASTAQLIFPDYSVEEIIEQNRMYEKTGDSKYCAPIGGYTKPMRFWGKKGDHELNYGMGYRSFSIICEIPEKDAKTIVEGYHAGHPGVKRYQRLVVDQLKQDRTVTNLFGRKIKYMERWGEQLFNRAYSYIPQSTVAHIINERGLIPLYYDSYFNKYADILMQTHDSITFQLPISLGPEGILTLLRKLKRIIEEPLKWQGSSFSIPLDIECGLCLGALTELNVEDKEESITKLIEVMNNK